MKNTEFALSSTALSSFKETLTQKPINIILVFKSNSRNSILQHEYNVEDINFFKDIDKTDVSFILSQSPQLIAQQQKNIYGFFLNKYYFFHVLENHLNLINKKELLFSIHEHCYDTFPHIQHFLQTGNIKFLPNML